MNPFTTIVATSLMRKKTPTGNKSLTSLLKQQIKESIKRYKNLKRGSLSKFNAKERLNNIEEGLRRH
jgi:hypothetical protein